MTRRGLLIESDFSVDDVGWILYAYGCLDYYDERAIRKILRPGSSCLDIGAHIGWYSLLLSRWVGPDGRVVSFEPVPYTYSFLVRNLERNGASNVMPEQAAVGKDTGVVRMSAAKGERLGWSTVSDSGELKVRCTTIDSEVERLKLQCVNFIKIDVEGFELQTLAGAEHCIRQMRPKIMAEVNRNALEEHDASPAQLQDFFLARNYGLFTAEQDELKPISDIGKGPTFFNVFAIPS
jgi:FkbM family methyltransferase